MNTYRCLPRFEYFAPTTVDEACSLLSKYGAEARVTAGGTDIIVSMKKRQSVPQYLIGLSKIAQLNDEKFDETGGLTLGALTTMQALADSAKIKKSFKPLHTAALKVGTPQVRNTATIGGNICNASPSADTVPSLIALEATLKLVGPGGERTVAITDFFKGPFASVIKQDEILTEIYIPPLPSGSAGCYKWVTKKTKVDETLVGVAALLVLDAQNGVCNDIRLGLCSVAPTPMRAVKSEKILKGKKIEDELIKATAISASVEVNPRSRADYRRKMTGYLVEEAINEAFSELGAN